MEKYGAFRDKGSGIAPFFPVPSQPAGVASPFHVFLFICRIPISLTATLSYFSVFCWLPIGSLGKKAALWIISGVPGIWWIDLQVDGVKKGSIGQYTRSRSPHPGSVIASSFTSPIDALYSAAIFDPLFTASCPGTRKVQRLTLWQAMFYASSSPPTQPPKNAKLVDLATLIKDHPDRCIAVFPECTTTNGRGILPFSPSSSSVPPKTKIFPVSLRYTPADITTPIPGAYWEFIWNLCSKPTHCIRVRIAEYMYNQSTASAAPKEPPRRNSYETNSLDDSHKTEMKPRTVVPVDQDGMPNDEEQKVLDKVGEALARSGRVKRVGLGVDEKAGFVQAWTKRR